MQSREIAREYTEAELIVRKQFKEGVGNIRSLNPAKTGNFVPYKGASLSFQVDLDDIELLQDAFHGGFPSPDRGRNTTRFVMLGKLALGVAKDLLYDDILFGLWKSYVDEWEDFYAGN